MEKFDNEINLRRMNEYNAYNVGVVTELRRLLIISAKQEKQVLKAITAINAVYSNIATQSITENGRTTKIIGNTDDNSHLFNIGD